MTEEKTKYNSLTRVNCANKDCKDNYDGRCNKIEITIITACIEKEKK